MANVLLAGAAAGAVAIAATVAVEKLGGRLGGLLGTLPTTIVPAAAGIWAASPESEAFASSMGAVPVGMWVNVLFLLVWREAPPRLPQGSLPVRLGSTVVLSLFVWTVVAVGAVVVMDRIEQQGVSSVAVGLAAAALSMVAGLVATARPRAAPKGSRQVGVVTLLARGVLAAAAIAVAVQLASAGPLISGMASVFPAIFLTSMVSLWWSQGESVQGGAVGPMMLGATSVSAYALFAASTIPAMGPWVGAVAAWLAAVGMVTVPAFGWLQWRQRVGLQRSG